MTVKHGKNLTGTWNSVTLGDVTDFTMKDESKVQTYASSSTSGQTKRLDGVEDRTGTFTMLADAMPSGLAKGLQATLVLTSDGSVDIFNANAMIQDISYTVDVNNLIKAVITFGQN